MSTESMVTQGHAGDAIDFALGHCGPDEAFAFLDDWRTGRANEWPGYVKWLSAQYRHRTAAQPEREAVLEEAAKVVENYDLDGLFFALGCQRKMAEAIRALKTTPTPAVSTEEIVGAGQRLINAIDGMIEDTNPIFAEMQIVRGRTYAGRQIGEQLEAFRAILSRLRGEGE